MLSLTSQLVVCQCRRDSLTDAHGTAVATGRQEFSIAGRELEVSQLVDAIGGDDSRSAANRRFGLIGREEEVKPQDDTAAGPGRVGGRCQRAGSQG